MLKKLLVMTMVLALSSFISLGCKKEEPKPKTPDVNKAIEKTADDATKTAEEAKKAAAEGAEKAGDAANKAAEELKK